MEDSVASQRLAVLTFSFLAEYPLSHWAWCFQTSSSSVAHLTHVVWTAHVPVHSGAVVRAFRFKTTWREGGYLAYTSSHSLHQKKSEQELKQGIKQQPRRNAACWHAPWLLTLWLLCFLRLDWPWTCKDASISASLVLGFKYVSPHLSN